MRKIIYALLPIIAILFFSVGCSDDVINEEPTVTVGETELILSKEAQEKAVSVTVDTGDTFTAKWSNVGTTEWGGVVASSTGVQISVYANAGEHSRVGLVTVVTTDGRTTKFISVHQNGISVTLEVLPNNLEFNQLSGSKTIAISTDAVGKWSISNDNDWITVTKRVAFNEAIITVTENTGTSDRVGKLVVTAGGNKKEITVKQNAPLDLIMPFLDFTRYVLEGGDVIDSIKKFELARGNQYAGFGWMGDIQYRTLSKNFPEIWYSVNRWDKYLYQIILHPSNIEVLDNPDFRQLIADNEFEYIYTKEGGGYTYFWREVDKVMLVIDKSTIEVQFFYPFEKPIDPGQAEDLPTFDEIPTGFSDWNATKAEIKAWEEEQGGTLFKDSPSTPQGFQQFTYKTNKTGPKDEFERSYWIDERFEKPQFMQTLLMYKDFTLAYFHSVDDDYYLTKEFKKLMTDNGFTHVPQSTGVGYYENLSKNVYLLPEIVDYDHGSGTMEKTLWIKLIKADNPPITSSMIAPTMQVLR